MLQSIKFLDLFVLLCKLLSFWQSDMEKFAGSLRQGRVERLGDGSPLWPTSMEVLQSSYFNGFWRSSIQALSVIILTRR